MISAISVPRRTLHCIAPTGFLDSVGRYLSVYAVFMSAVLSWFLFCVGRWALYGVAESLAGTLSAKFLVLTLNFR